jgi:hypothetical protein
LIIKYFPGFLGPNLGIIKKTIIKWGILKYLKKQAIRKAGALKFKKGTDT